MIKAIAFDYGGVVSLYGPIQNWANNNLDKNDEKFLILSDKSSRWDLGELSLKEVYETFSIITGVPADQIWNTFFEKSMINKDVVTLIKKLKKNYKIILFSNHYSELLFKLLELHKIRNLFDEIIISSEHKIKKPDPNFFKLLKEVSEVGKNEIIFIDDRERNIDAGNNFGIKSFLFTSFKQLVKDLEKENIKLNPSNTG